MSVIRLSEFEGADDRERFAAALSFMKARPGTTLTVEPGVYRITTERARAAQRSVMTGEWGNDAQKVMFTPEYRYDRALDFKGHEGSTVDAYGATLLFDGFMEGISIRHCRGVTVRGFTLDHVRRPFSSGRITNVRREGGATLCDVDLTDDVFPKTPLVRAAVYSAKEGRFVPEKTGYFDRWVISPRKIGLRFDNGFVPDEGDEFACAHVFHTRPGVLIEDAEDTTVEDVTVRSWPGMGLTAQKSRDIAVRRLAVVPAEGERFSTNTDATHFAACRGKLTVDGCRFEGQGDDSINVHTYYYTVTRREGRTFTLVIKAPDGTHTQSLVYPLPGDRFELTEISSLNPVDSFRVVSSVPDPENGCCHVTLDRDPPEDIDGFFFADPDEVPEVEFVNCTAKNHFARSILLKARRCLVENCTVEASFEDAVKIAAEAGWHEGINSESVTVRNCRFVGCGVRSNIGCGGVSVYMDTEKDSDSHGEVTIENVTVDCPNVPHGIVLKNVRRATVKNCEIRSSAEPIVVGEGVSFKEIDS